MIRGLSQRFRKKDEPANTTSATTTTTATSGGSRIADGAAATGVSSISPLELLLQQQEKATPPSPTKTRPPPPTSAPPSSSSSSSGGAFQQRLVYAMPTSSAPPPPRRDTGAAGAPPPPRTAAPLVGKSKSEDFVIEFDDDTSTSSNDDDDEDDDDDDGPMPGAPRDVDDDDDDDDEDDAALFQDDSDEFAEEPLPPVPSEPSPFSTTGEPPPPPSQANPQMQLVDELLNGDFLNNAAAATAAGSGAASLPSLSASAPSIGKLSVPASAREGSRERTLTRTTREKHLPASSQSMRSGTLTSTPTVHELGGGAKRAILGGPGLGGTAAATLAAAAAGRAAVLRAHDPVAPGLLKSASEPNPGARAKEVQQQTGWLHKKGKRRWFLLRGNVLYWFSKEVDPMADIGKGVNNYLELAGCAVTATDQPRFSVRIVPPATQAKAKPYTLTAPDEATRARWIRALAAAAADVRDNDTRIVTSGYMVKKGKRRFFVVEDDQLKWYLSSKMGKAEFKGCLQLATCRLSGVPLTHSVILDSTSAAKSYEMITSSPDEYKHWMQMLDGSIRHAQMTWRQRHGSRALRAGGLTTPGAGDDDGAPPTPRSAYWTFVIEQTILVTTPDGTTFTSYMVDVTAPNGAQRTVLKRYRQFDDLDAALRQNVADRSNVPSLPTKKMIGNMNPQFVRNRCLGLQRYLNQVAQLAGINEMPEFIYFVTEHAADDGWHDSRPLTSMDITLRWAWLDEHRAAAAPPPPLVDPACLVDAGLRLDCGCTEAPPWHTQKGATRPVPVAPEPSTSPRSPRTLRGATASSPDAAGGDDDDDDAPTRDANMLIEDTVDRDVLYYRSYFAGRAHDNYVSPVDTEVGPVVLTVDGEGVAITTTSRVYKVLLRTKRGDRRYSLTSAKARGERLKELRVKCGLADVPLTRVRDPEIEKRLVDYERKLLVGRYKFGVLRVGAGQRAEDEIYANTAMPAPFERFLGVLGERIALLGFDGYTGGLNTRDGSTGTHSVYTKFHNFEVMFHVAPMLPFFEDDKQQVERKRHLGNDVVLVIFLDPDAAAFDPRILTSHFNSAFVLVRPAAAAPDQYDVVVVHKSDVRPVRPYLSTSGGVARLAGTPDEMHALLLTKLINLERAAMASGEFIGLDMRTRNLMLSDICTTFEKK